MSNVSTPEGFLVRAQDGPFVSVGGGFGVRYLLEEAQTDGAFALVEHPIGPRHLAAPRHTHRNEDEYTYVTEGEVGVEVAGEALVVRAGELVLKPRGIPHAVWNASDAPARMLEIIAPAAFASYFTELASLVPADGPPDMAALGALWARYELDMDLGSVAELCERHAVHFGPAGR
jgi:mannose-6-phosphate isomerase-like protein (cupin superfamily)